MNQIKRNFFVFLFYESDKAQLRTEEDSVERICSKPSPFLLLLCSAAASATAVVLCHWATVVQWLLLLLLLLAIMPSGGNQRDCFNAMQNHTHSNSKKLTNAKNATNKQIIAQSSNNASSQCRISVMLTTIITILF